MFFNTCKSNSFQIFMIFSCKANAQFFFRLLYFFLRSALDPIKLPVPSSLHCLDFLLLSEDCSKLYAQLQLLLFFLFQYHILFVFFLLIHYECDVTNAIMPPMINNGKAMYISPPITIPINITGKKITVQSSFIIPQDALNPNIKNFPTNQIIQIANNNDNIFYSF